MTDSVRTTPVVSGITMNLVWVAALFGICATDYGQWRSDWMSCGVWCSIMALPAVLAIIGLVREKRAFVIAAASLCVPLAFISLAGAGLPMIVPGVLFAISTRNSKPSSQGGELAFTVVVILGAAVVVYFVFLIGPARCVRSVTSHRGPAGHQIGRAMESKSGC